MILNSELFVLPPSEVKRSGNQNLTYGSLTDKGVNTLVKVIEKYHPTPIYGFDLGCGDGELIYHLQNKLYNSVWEGVEISEHRVYSQFRDVTIWQGDMLAENYRPYNILHADNLCLEDDIAEKLEDKIAIEFSGIYITYRTPESLRFLKNSIKLDTVSIETTWNNHYIHFYRVF